MASRRTARTTSLCCSFTRRTSPARSSNSSRSERPMSWATGLMVYLVIWWTILFAVLPLGVKRVENPGRGQDHGAPEKPEILRKAVITSIVAAVLWIGFYFLNRADIFS